MFHYLPTDTFSETEDQYVCIVLSELKEAVMKIHPHSFSSLPLRAGQTPVRQNSVHLWSIIGNNGINLNLNKPIWVNETGHLHDGVYGFYVFKID